MICPIDLPFSYSHVQENGGAPGEITRRCAPRPSLALGVPLKGDQLRLRRSCRTRLLSAGSSNYNLEPSEPTSGSQTKNIWCARRDSNSRPPGS